MLIKKYALIISMLILLISCTENDNPITSTDTNTQECVAYIEDGEYLISTYTASDSTWVYQIEVRENNKILVYTSTDGITKGNCISDMTVYDNGCYNFRQVTAEYGYLVMSQTKEKIK